ncbi:RNA-directed DNA polymerase, eukaryota, reverse transcriptase zinc-binding domain protein [Tanacetum coccineum]
MINEKFIEKFPNSYGIFMPYIISDHSPAVLRIPKGMERRRKAFRFSNFIIGKKEFIPTKDGNIFERVTKLRESLKESQTEVDKHPHCEIVKEKSCKLLNEYYEALKDKSNMFMQKAKVDWLKDGDRNTKFFHKIIKSRMHKEFLGKKDVITKFPTEKLVFPNKISVEEGNKMCRDVCDVEVKNAMFDIDDNKAPRPDGYTTRLKGVLGNLVHESQSAFIAGRQISDNILLAHELFKWYNRKQNARKVAFKIDLQKAYDTISWDFIEVVLKQFGFPKKMVDWIMVCVSTTKFSININGEREGYFSGGRGLRQGDPMSPYLFTLVMEVFNLIMRKNISGNKNFKYHHRCKKLEITHLSFDDDLLVFCHSVIKEALEEFSSYSRLKANMHKSTVFFGGMTSAEQNIILGIVPFAIGKLPVRYVGVSLITKKISSTDCKPLIDKVRNRVLDWRNKALSYSGRLQLISSVLSAMQIYWAYVFLLPKNVIYEINKILKGFLWCQGELTKGKAKISWKSVCKPKEQGGLGIKNLQLWNETLLIKQLWNVIVKKNTIWVKWVNSEILRGKSIWEVNA